MKLAIFGDSYADINGDHDRTSWPNILKSKVDDVYVKGLCGTSIWWSYLNFLKYVSTNKPDSVIFCHTNPFRWPSLPEEFENDHWIIGVDDALAKSQVLASLNKHYFDLFPKDLSEMIATAIFDKVNAYCRQNDIYLINVLCFDFKDIYEFNTEFPVINDIDKVSHHERIQYNGKTYTPMEAVSQFKMIHGDPRICHFGVNNNKRLADILYQMLEDRTTNVQVNAIHDYEWDQFDKSNDNLYTLAIERYKQ